MPFDFEVKVGDSVRTFNDLVGTVTRLNYHKGLLSSVTVRWMTGLLVTHPCTADDFWLEGHAEKESPEVKAHKWFVAHQDEIHSRNLAWQADYQLAIKNALEAGVNIVWEDEPVDEEATLDGLATSIQDWSQIVRHLNGHDKEDWIKHQLFSREYIHGLLNGLKKQGVDIPANLLDALAQADQYFLDHSIALLPPDIKPLMNLSPASTVSVRDIKAFWYEYRWPRCQER